MLSYSLAKPVIIEGYIFTPESITLPNISEDKSEQNFTATKVTTVGISKVMYELENIIIYSNPTNDKFAIKFKNNTIQKIIISNLSEKKTVVKQTIISMKQLICRILIVVFTL